MKNLKQQIFAVGCLSLAFLGSAQAENFTGYVASSYTGPSASNSFNAALIGFSEVLGGAATLYRFTGDLAYYDSLMKAYIANQKVRIQETSGTITGVHFD